MDRDDNPYEILGIAVDATESDIKKAYRKAALKYHPDRQQTEEDKVTANHIFAKIAEAYETLTDPVKRYDWRQGQEKRDERARAKARHEAEVAKAATAAATTRKSAAAAGAPPPPGSKSPKRQSVPVQRSTATPTSPKRKSTANVPMKKTTTPSAAGGGGGTARPSHSKSPGPVKKRTSAAPPHPPGAPFPGAATGRSSTAGPTKRQSSPHPVSPKSGPKVKPKKRESEAAAWVRNGPTAAAGGAGGKAPPPPPGAPPMGKRSSGTTPTATTTKRHSATPGAASGRGGGSGPGRGPAGSRPSAVKIPTTVPTKKPFRDPFAVFDDLMKEEYGDDYKHKDIWENSKGVSGLAKMANPFRRSSVENTHKEFKKLDINKDKSLSKDELMKYIETHSELWTVLGVQLNLPVKKCMELATDVAFALATGEGITKPAANEYRKHRDITEDEFKTFHKHYVLNGKGSHEFFLRTIFAAFDLNGDGVLDRKEFFKFLDIFYASGEVFKGKMKLPEKKELMNIVGARLDKNKDGLLGFEEIRSLLEVVAVVTQQDKN